MKFLTCLLLSAIIVVACTTQKPSLPKCLEAKIKEYSTSSSCSDAKVDEYTFQGKTVYAFGPGTCGADMTTEVMTADCTTLGRLGGIAGNTKINGEEFSNAKFVKTVWKK
ncbi:DUF6970 domain-containing protein [Daejeonella lutea]|uniref:DUF6970 domain-containing protein n=1 Tax=Daejeonella lutea TaxID=572036 RepID=A0A1T5BL77_9SPHI|nr:hypothetical protein [Daejeonella lutea]SKB48042.1 hypothetical protein SAMN05661099_1604 [Daejeonella lutea]